MRTKALLYGNWAIAEFVRGIEDNSSNENSFLMINSVDTPAILNSSLIRAFYIIIFIPYIILLECYLHCYIDVLHVFLDDLWDFHTKSLFLAFNIWEAEYPLFLFLLFQEFRELK